MPASTTWRNQRKICNLHIFASHTLDANQYLRRTKVEQLLADVRHSSRVGEAVEIRQAAFKTTLSFMSITIFSIDLSDSSQISEEFREIVQGILEELRKPNFGDYFPMANLDLQGNRRRMTIHLRKIMDLFDNVIDERVELRRMSDYETLRLHPPAPFLIPRKAEADIEVHNFVVPKGAQLFINAWVIGRDPNFWEEPDLFRPERFIRSEMDVKGKDFGLIPFGGGRRICPGLPLAMRILHSMLGTLIHSFDWELEDGVAPENLNMDEYFTLFYRKLNH
ncbi:Cytochrome P450 [Gossypium australe]|uniref:Cytochrome P450 n=1 Tax=Gossypium australe TaxID=47621 RepID=A0A5B6VJ04_9ROSI|nr:Cytochrome P450 [Gossypium australe]